MAKEAVSTVPSWVRCLICIVGGISVPTLVVAACFGVQISHSLAVVVCAFALQTSNLAFGKEGNIKKWISKRNT